MTVTVISRWESTDYKAGRREGKEEGRSRPLPGSPGLSRQPCPGIGSAGGGPRREPGGDNGQEECSLAVHSVPDRAQEEDLEMNGRPCWSPWALCAIVKGFVPFS